MKRQASFVILSMLIIPLFYACPGSLYPKRNFPKGFFPDSIVNLQQLNSEYDDINMDIMMLFSTDYIIFSSNRNSQGEQFDLVGNALTFSWDQINGNFLLNTDAYSQNDLLQFILQKTVSDANEYGPFAFCLGDSTYLFLASDKNGKNNMEFYSFPGPFYFATNYSYEHLINGPQSIPFLSNSEINEGYVSFQTKLMPYDEFNRVFEIDQLTHLIYCSDSLGQYDIYSIEMPSTFSLQNYLATRQIVVKENLEQINSSSNDRCPNVCGNFMIFSSNRPGGLGGYDFYYSIYEDSTWSAPVNMGAPFNSPHDEYRAVAIKSYEFENDLLIFSSNKPGGLGGFDIYYTGINVMPNNHLAY